MAVCSSNISQQIPAVNIKQPSKNQLSFPGMIHHNVTHKNNYLLIRKNERERPSPYGVSRKNRVLSPGMLLKEWDKVRYVLKTRLGLKPAQETAVLRLLRLWAYYGFVYPKAGQVAQEPEISDAMAEWRASEGLEAPRGSYGCSRATFWRTIKILKDRGLIEVVNRYRIHPNAQISNLYRLDKLIIVIARYLAEHGKKFTQKWLADLLGLRGSVFWTLEWALYRSTQFYNMNTET